MLEAEMNDEETGGLTDRIGRLVAVLGVAEPSVDHGPLDQIQFRLS